MILGRLGKGFCAKKQGVRIFGQNFWLGCFSDFKHKQFTNCKKNEIIHRYFYRFMQKQPPRGVPRKRCSENMQQIYRRTLWHRCSSVNLLHIFRTPFSKNTYGWLLLTVVSNNLIKRCDQKIRQGKNQRIKHQIRKKNLSNQACEVSVLFCFCFFSNDCSVLYLESYKSRTHYSITVKFSTVQRK